MLHNLIYKLKYHNEVSTVADHIPAYFLKLYRKGVLQIFDLYFQDLAREAMWKDDQLYYDDELELNEVIQDDIDLEWILEEDQPLTRKIVKFYEQDDASMASLKKQTMFKA